jgi:hypothetical protein
MCLRPSPPDRSDKIEEIGNVPQELRGLARRYLLKLKIATAANETISPSQLQKGKRVAMADDDDEPAGRPKRRRKLTAKAAAM